MLPIKMNDFDWLNVQIPNRLGTHPKGGHSASHYRMIIPRDWTHTYVHSEPQASDMVRIGLMCQTFL